MKKYTIVLMIILVAIDGCGQETASSSYYFSLGDKTIIWKGWGDEDASYKSLADAVRECVVLNNFAVPTQGYPYIEITSGPFYCGSTTYTTFGCYFPTSGTIYVIQDRYGKAHMQTLQHELLHWAARLGNEAHADPIFLTCAPNDTLLITYY